ncbi:hypothetical protein Rhe02_87850 [Rhizocola hellebori]|uniref:Uncharacterized protein n=1 Tax=Rhizocola hellebori TaxID=1392758 RepID=A0A8J3QJW1_9ACTN|nr:hypothetical protein [Rhizocola hellebori]GIH10718.1 hypothetical protein Rhe02_87850 [Rhizocola hellebori]
MSEFHDSDPLRTLFAEYEDDTAPQIRAAGVAAATIAVRRLRKVRSTLIAAGVALLFAMPVAAYALMSRPTGPPVTPGSPGPTVSASPTPRPPATPVATEPVPAGGISRDELRSATFDVPAFVENEGYVPCGSGSIAFINGSGGMVLSENNRQLIIGGVSYADIDGNGQWETIVHLECSQGETGPQQLIALRRAGSTIQTVGAVVKTDAEIQQFYDFTGMSDGTVQVNVRSGRICCDVPYSSMQHQVRGYGWTGQRFEQVLGSRSFHSDKVNLQVTVSKLVFGKPTAGVRTGTVMVRVSNTGPVAVEDVILLLSLRHAEVAGPGWAAERWLPRSPARHFETLRPGENLELDLSVTTTQANVNEVGVQIFAFSAMTNGDLLADSKPDDNEGSGNLAGISPEIQFG